MRKVGISWIAIVVALLAAPAQGQEKAAQLVPLVQLQGYELVCKGAGTFGFGGRYCQSGTAQERSITVFRSGRVISILTMGKKTGSLSGEQVTYTSTPLPSAVREAQAPRRAVVDLIAFLQSQGISFRTGPCDPLPPAPPTDFARPFSFAEYSIIWFQENGARSYTVLDSRSTRACQPQIHAIFDAIVTFGETGGRTAE